MANQVEIVTIPEFNVCERRLLKNLKSIKININAVTLNADVKYKLFKSVSENDFVNDNKKIKFNNTDILSASINLGRYLHEKNDILYKFAYCYAKVIHIDYKMRQSTNNKFASFIPIVEEPKPIVLKEKFYNLDIEEINSLEFLNDEPEITDYHKDKKLTKLLLKWLKYGGISEEYVEELEYTQNISMEYILHIFDLCLVIYDLFIKVNNHTITPEELTYNTTNIPIKRNGKFSIEKQISDLLSLSKVMLITHSDDDFKHLRECEYCHDWFFGRPNKKCCSGSCKDYKNNKSKKRKIKRQQQREERKRSDRICC